MEKGNVNMWICKQWRNIFMKCFKIWSKLRQTSSCPLGKDFASEPVNQLMVRNIWKLKSRLPMVKAYHPKIPCRK